MDVIGFLRDPATCYNSLAKHSGNAWNMMTSSNGNIFRGQWRGTLMFSLIYAPINGWVNNRDAGNLRRHRAHYDVIVMKSPGWQRSMVIRCRVGAKVALIFNRRRSEGLCYLVCDILQSNWLSSPRTHFANEDWLRIGQIQPLLTAGCNYSHMATFNGGLAKPPLKFWHGWVHSHTHTSNLCGCNYVFLSCYQCRCN